MPSVPSNVYPVLLEVSRYLFALLGVLAVLSVLAWILAENRARRDRLRSLPAAGMIGELVVLSGSSELPPQTWFPVPREGVLGSFRSCDLVVPCHGVRARHLDFVWRDGVGLLIRPRSGCEAQVNHALLDCHSDAAACPLTHGGFLRIGDALLRLQVFKALDHTAAESALSPADQAVPFPPDNSSSQLVPGFSADPVSVPIETAQRIPASVPSAPPFLPQAAFPQADGPFVIQGPVPAPDAPAGTVPSVPPQAGVSQPGNAPPAPDNRSPRRADRWKEEWGE